MLIGLVFVFHWGVPYMCVGFSLDNATFAGGSLEFVGI